MSQQRGPFSTRLYVLGGLAILFGIFVFWASQDIPLPNNAKKEGDMIYIDLSDGATNQTEKKESLFVVPEQFKPGVSAGTIDFYFKYPSATPYTGNESPIPSDSIRVVIRHHAKAEAARSSYVLRRTQPKDGALFATPWFVENKDGMGIYQYRINATAIGTYYSFVARDGRNILAGDPGEWSGVFKMDRPYTPHIELTYLVGKPLIRDSIHFVEDVTAVDNAVLKLIQSFQPK